MKIKELFSPIIHSSFMQASCHPLKRHLMLFLIFVVLTNFVNAQGHYGTYFKHEVTPANQQDNYTLIDHEELNDNPDAIFLVTSSMGPTEVSANNHYSVYYEEASGLWSIRSTSSESFPIGSVFNVLIPSANGAYFRVTAPGEESKIAIDHWAADGMVGKNIFITPLYPGNREYVAIYAPAPFNKWAISQITKIPAGQQFNVFIPNQSNRAFVHRVQGPNNSSTALQHPWLDDNPNGIFLFQRRFTFHNNASTAYNNRTKSARYHSGNWHIEIDDGNVFHNFEDYSIVVLNDAPVGLEQEKTKSNAALYPNPVNHILKIELTAFYGSDVDFVIFDLCGKQVHSGLLKNDVISEIDVASLSDGVYVLELKSENMQLAQKFIVAR